ncbi:MAG: UDP-phosphate galactose phosphotransferase [Nitrospirales bacterium]|nr:MAG: UDP-phosphate galactose phosphotransferase [Nitrospirales bacterium]
MQVRRKILIESLKGIDLILLILAFSLSVAIAYTPSGNISFSDFFAIRVKVENIIFVSAMVILWHSIFSFFQIYESRRLSTLKDECLDLLKSMSLATFVLVTAAVIFNVEIITQGFVLAFWSIGLILIVGSRLVLRFALKQARLNGRNIRNILIAGTNPRAIQFARDIQAKPELGYNLVGFLDEPWAGTDHFKQTGNTIVSDFKNFQSFLRCFVIDEVMIALPVKSYYAQAAQIVEQCEEQGVLIRVLGNMFSPKFAHERVEHFGTHSLLTLQPGALGDQAFFFKRIIDILVSLPILLMLLPFFVLIAIAIKISGKGPIFFAQNRIGRNKRQFRLFKFRTMVPGAEKMLKDIEHLNEVEGAAFKIEDDPRLTSIGRLLRKTSIDELPQLWNVLKGDMSLVGPRPLPIRDFQEFTEDWHRRRFSVPPGITCLWQVNGRSRLSFEKWMELDMQYIDQWTLWLDLKILLKTIPVVLRGTGAA